MDDIPSSDGAAFNRVYGQPEFHIRCRKWLALFQQSVRINNIITIGHE